MCEICRRTPCPAMCPNADRGEPPYYCDSCGRPIYYGETAFEIDCRVYCHDCMDEGEFEVQDC